MSEKPKISDEQIRKHKTDIDKMSHYELAKFRRYAHAGHIYFDHRLPLALYFENRFQSMGGMTPEISKQINIEVKHGEQKDNGAR